MTYSPRTIHPVGPDDTLYRLASAKFSRMVDDPESHRLERFAGQRVRMVEAIVEVRERTPCAVARLVYEMLGFDARDGWTAARSCARMSLWRSLSWADRYRRARQSSTRAVASSHKVVAGSHRRR